MNLSDTLSREMRDALRSAKKKPPVALSGNALAGIAYSLAEQALSDARSRWRDHRTWTVSVSGDDEFYFEVQEWLADQGQSAARHGLTAHTRYIGGPFGGGYGGGPPKRILRFLADDDLKQKITIRGHEVTVFVDDHEGTARRPGGGEQNQNMQVYKPPRLIFTARTRQARDAVTAELTELRKSQETEKRSPSLMVLDKWGEWRRRSDLPPRPMESVIVKGDVVERLRADLEEFTRREPDYVRRAIPFHRAYLLVGPPGTGKTSAVKAITNALGLDLWYAQLSGIDKDAKLSDVFGDVRAHGVLLLEDIDSLPAAIDRTAEDAPEGDISTSGLLNALDGVATPHGLITVMTTNHPTHLDPTLMRPGRIDRVFTFENPDTPTLRSHFEFFYARPAPRLMPDPQGRSSAVISEIFKRHMDDPEAALAALRKSPEDDQVEVQHGNPGVQSRKDPLSLAYEAVALDSDTVYRRRRP